MRWVVRPGAVGGTVRVPGDKSLAHRALMLGALADGESVISGLPDGADVSSTMACLQRLGVEVTRAEGRAVIRGGIQAPDAPLDTGNSGTTMRLLAGILAGQPFHSTLTGDESLSRRPMGRVVTPLESMGATIQTNDGRAPLRIRGGSLRGIRYTLPVASAQVKSAILLAGLFADGDTVVEEPIPTRDHTERLLGALGADINRDGNRVRVRACTIRPFTFDVPGDPSSAAFLAAVGVLHGREVVIPDVALNPRRLGFFDALEQMGARVQVGLNGERLGEPVGTIRVSGKAERPVAITADQVPSLVDELPLLALIATQARGTTVVRGARELRVKETDRIAAVSDVLGRLGASIDTLDDGFVINGPTRLTGALVESHGDHRLAMLCAVAGTVAMGETVVAEAEAADVSYPGFREALTALGGAIDVA